MGKAIGNCLRVFNQTVNNFLTTMDILSYKLRMNKEPC